MNNKKSKLPYILLLPAIISLVVFVFYPIINSLVNAFIKDGQLSLTWFTKGVINNSSFQIGLKNTLLYALITTPISLLIAFVISFALSNIKKLNNFFQTVLFLPYVTSTIAIGLTFSWMFHSNYGIINQVLTTIGIPTQEWLTNPDLSIVVLSIFGVWKSLAFNILMIYTALQTIDPNLEKAALIDGASRVKIFIKIKLAQIRPILIYLFIINTINSFKVYDDVVALFGSAGTGGSARTIVYFIYEQINNNKLELASAAALVLFVIILAFTFLNKYLAKRGSHEKI